MSKKNNKNLADKVRDINEKEEMKEEIVDVTEVPIAEEATVDLSSVSIITAENGPENLKEATPEEIRVEFPAVDEAAKKSVEHLKIDKEAVSSRTDYENLPEDTKQQLEEIAEENTKITLPNYRYPTIDIHPANYDPIDNSCGFDEPIGKPGDATISEEAKYVVVVDYRGIDEKKRNAYQEKLDRANVDYVVNADGTFMAGPYEIERDAILIKKRIESRGLKCKVVLYDDFIKAE